MAAVTPIGDLWRGRAVLGHFVSLHLTTNYRTKTLGFFWALLDPLLFMGVYYLVFGRLIARRPLEFMLHLFVAVVAFRLLQKSLTQASSIVRSQASVIKEIRFRRAMLPISVVIARLVDFGAGWVVAVPLAVIFHSPPTYTWVFVPVIAVIELAFVLGLALVTAYIGVFFADIQNILDVVLRLWFYMSPVLYDLDLVRRRTAGHPLLYKLYMLNPMTNIVDAYQAATTRAQVPSMGELAFAGVAAAAMLILGFVVFSRGEGHIGKYV